MNRTNRMEVRYDELKAGDVILFHGANERVVSVTTTPAPANEWYPNECTVRFVLEPADEKAVEILGSFYSHGCYGGVGCLTATKIC